MSDASLALQQAVYDALAQSIPLQNLIGSPPRLYDHHRQEPIFPYVVIGEVRVSDYSGLAGGFGCAAWRDSRALSVADYSQW
jgi:Protein of unknown function (DUF3168)